MATKGEVEAVLKLKDEMSAKIDGLNKRIDKLSKKKKEAESARRKLQSGFKDMASQITGLNPKMLGLAGAVAAVGVGVFKATKETINLGAQLVDLSSKTGLSVQELQELKFAGEQAGVGFQAISDAAVRLGRRTAAELPEATKMLGALGLSVDDILSRNPGDAFQLVAEKIASLESPAQQAAAAMGVFGDAGLQILPAINQGVTENIERFRELGAAMSDETAQGAKKLSDSLTDLSAQWTGIKNSIGGVVIPALSDILSFFGDLVPGAVQKTIAALADFNATAVELQAKAFDVLALAPGDAGKAFTGLADETRNSALELRKFADEMEEKARKNFIKFGRTAVETSGSVNKAKVSTDEFSRALAEQSEKTKKAKEETEKARQTLDGFNKMMFEAKIQIAEAAQEAEIFAAAMSGAVQPSLEIPQDVLDITGVEIPGGFEKSKENAEDFGDSVSAISGFMRQLGVDADSVFGKILGWLDRGLGLLSSFGNALDGLGSLFGGGGGLSAIPTAGLAATLGGGGGGAAAAGGAAAGGLGLGALAATGYGALAAGAIFAIRAALKKASAETTAEFLGIDFDVLSKGLQDTLQDMGKQIGDFSTALQLNLGQVFQEGGIGGIDQFAEKISDTFSFLERGQLNSAQAQEILNETVSQLLPQVDELGAEGVHQLERLFAAAEQTGIGFEGMDELAKAYVERANELGIAVNNVVLEALGLTDALGELGTTGEEALGGAAENTQLLSELAKELQGDFAGVRRELAGLDVPAGGTPNIPDMAHGGYIPPRPGGTLVRMAERGEGEFAIPESKMGGMGGGTVNLNLAVTVEGVVSDANRVARELQETLNRAFRDGLITTEAKRALGLT